MTQKSLDSSSDASCDPGCYLGRKPSYDPARDPERKPSREGVLRAAAKLARLLPPTPLLPLEVDGKTLWCKAEMLQPIGAFKIRGAWHRLSDLTPEQRKRGVVGVSSGNHAQGVAWAARRLSVSATIVMPRDAPAAKLRATKAWGAQLVLYDRKRESRDDIAAAIVAESGRVLVHAFGDPWVIEGQGTLGIEASEQLKTIVKCEALRPLEAKTQPKTQPKNQPKTAALSEEQVAFDQLVVCCGGGGLASGLALACPDAQVTIVEPHGWDDVIRSLESGAIQDVGINPPTTLCDALQTPRTYPLNFEVLRQRQVRGVTVTDNEVRYAMRLIFEKLHLVAEPGGAVALAAVLAGKVELHGTMLVTLSGGNVDAASFAQILSDSG